MTEKRLRYVIIEKETYRLCADGDSIIESDDLKEMISILAAIMVNSEDYTSFGIYDNKRKKDVYISHKSRTFSKVLKYAFLRNDHMREFIEFIIEAKEDGRK